MKELDIEKEMKRVMEVNKVLKEGLLYYANRNNYRSDRFHRLSGIDKHNIVLDKDLEEIECGCFVGGKKARQILDKLQNNKEK